MLKKCIGLLFLSLAFSSQNLISSAWEPFQDVEKTVEMMAQVAIQIPENVREKMQRVIRLESRKDPEDMHYRVQGHYRINDMWVGTIELTINEQVHRTGRHVASHYSVSYEDLGHTEAQIGTEPIQQYSEEVTDVTDARKMAEIILQVTSLIGADSWERIKNVTAVTAQAQGSSTVFYIFAHYRAGDFWQGTLEVAITETARRVGRRLINTYEVSVRDLGAE